MTDLRYGSLFSGAGGLDLAVEQVTGATCAWHSEIEPGPTKVLAHRWPDTSNHGDISAIDWSQVEPVDILCGGFPCQDVSTAGLGAGLKEGTRSGLWYRYADAIRHLRPRYVFVENVAALVVRGLDAVAGSLADLGYDAEWGCLRASDVGAPHARNRLWLVAADTHGVHGPQRHQWTQQPGEPTPHGDNTRGRGVGHGWEASPYVGCLARWAGIIGRPAPHPTDDRGRLNPVLAEWMMGWPEGWVTDLLPRSAALKAIGNGVCPQQAVAAFSGLLGRFEREVAA